MTPFTRAVARDFDILFGKCVAGRPRGPAPPVVVAFADGVRTLAATTAGGVTLTHTSPAPGEPDDRLVLPMPVLAGSAGGTDEAVVLKCTSKLRGVVAWPGGGKPRSLTVELILPGEQHALPETPALAAVSPSLLAALHECGKSAARDSGRFALSRIQVQGKAGRVVGTDGKVALLWGGFRLPFADDLLVPAVPVFGTKPLARPDAVRVGRTATHLVVAAGPWAVRLPVEPNARYPDVAGVIPRRSPAVARIADADAVELSKILPGLPGGDDEYRPVTVEADRVVSVRGRDGTSGEVKGFTLTRSRAEGPPVRVAVDRRVLARALSLGCRTVRLTPDRPVVLCGGNVTLVAAGLEPAAVVPPGPDELPAGNPKPAAASVAAGDDAGITTNNSDERSNVMGAKPPETNGHAPPRGDPPDPLADAEDLRLALADALARTTKLIASLKAERKGKKALSAVWANLKQLNLGPGGPP